MKKRYLLMCLSVMILTVLVLASCGECSTLHTEHEFNERVASEEYFAQEATCSSGPRYYYSCKCGAKHTQRTFANGLRNPTAHSMENGVCGICGLAESTQADGIVYVLNSDGESYTLRDATNCTAREVTVGIFNGLPVTAVGKEAFFGNRTVEKIALSDAVRFVGDRAFYGCSSLTEIRLSERLDTLPLFCFRDCVSLKSIKIPVSVLTIEESAFEGCTALEDIELHRSIRHIGTRAFGGCVQLQEIQNGVVYIDTWAYSYVGEADTVTQITLRSGTNGIMCHAFQNLKQLKKVVTGGDIRVIEEYAFQGCEALTEIALPSSLVIIGESAFRGCSSLASVTLPENMWEIGEYAFAECTALASICIPNGIKYIEKGTFEGCTALKTAILDGTALRGIQTCAFRGCSSLESVTLHDETDQWYTITSIAEEAFAGCSSLASINLPNHSRLYIETTAFDGCDLVVENTDGVLYVGNHAIDCDENATEIIFREGTLTVAEEAFYGCTALTHIQFSASTVDLDWDWFWNCTALETVVLPKWEYISPYLFEKNKPSAVYYLGSAEEFAQAVAYINNLYDIDLFADITVYFYSETEPTEEGVFWHFGADGKPVLW